MTEDKFGFRKIVPTSKFLRERRKWLRYVNETNESIIISHRSKQNVVLVPVEYFADLVDKL
jgi:PHD/YefM family antitoxin component YafN of YafNO toxin-antitoxin module